MANLSQTTPPSLTSLLYHLHPWYTPLEADFEEIMDYKFYDIKKL
jgi:hypothetical protein